MSALNNNSRAKTWCASRINILLRFLEQKLYDYAEEHLDQYAVEEIKKSAKGHFYFGYYYQIPNISYISKNMITLEELGPEAVEAKHLIGELAKLYRHIESGIANMAWAEKILFPDSNMLDEIIEQTIGFVNEPHKPTAKKGKKA